MEIDHVALHGCGCGATLHTELPEALGGGIASYKVVVHPVSQDIYTTVQGSPSGSGVLEIPAVSRVENGEHRHS